jgi:hypothetical protein
VIKFNETFWICLQAIQADILGHRDALNKLEDKASNLKDSRPIALVRELNSRYQQLHDSAKDMTLRLDDIVRGHEEYRKAYISCLDWLANNRHRLQRLSDYTGDRQTLQDRLQQLKVSKTIHQIYLLELKYIYIFNERKLGDLVKCLLRTKIY